MKCTFKMWLVHLIWLFHSSVSVMVVKHPSPWSSWVEMETAQVDCVFDSYVGCAWYRNGTVVKIIQRYEYKYPSTDQGSKDCSIFIRNSSLNDSGWWQCSNKIDSQGNPLIRSNPGWISIRPLEIVVHPQKMLKVKRNAPNVLLQCEFNAEVNCSWMRNGITTENGFDYWDRKCRTKMCTILFTDILYSTHSGNWSCSNNMSSSTGRIIYSNVAQVYVEEPLVLEHPPNELVVELGKIVVLLCIWDVRVLCRWKHNSMTVTGNIFKYTYNKRNSNCSLVIRGVGVEDEGRWKCVDGQNEATTSQETQLKIESFPPVDCIRCEDFNRIQPPGCAQDYTQCGDCLINFIQDPDEPSFCFTLEILTDANEEISQKANSEIHLVCKFNAPVHCSWKKDGNEVKDIGPQYNRKWSNGDGKRTDDCSLTIADLSDEDVGNWVCSSRASSNFNELSSKPMQLYIQPTMIKRPEEKYEVEEGNSVTLPCVFNRPVTCLWTKDGDLVPNNENQHYAAAIGADCSLTIATVSKMDNGEWTCSAKGDASENDASTILKTAENNDVIVEPPPTKAAKTLASPLIYYGSEVVNGATLMYPGVAAIAEPFRLQCQLPGIMYSGHRLWWVLHDDREYQEQSNGPLNVGTELGTAIVQQLKSRDRIELICMAEDGSKQVSTANVFFIVGVSQSDVVTEAASSFDNIIVLFVFMVVIVLALLGAIAALMWALRKDGKHQ